MKRIDRYILKSFIGPFFAILFIVLFILMMQSLWLYIDELVGKGLSLRVVAEFLMWGSFLILPLALPLATLLSSMMVMGQMAEHNELTALKAAGVSVTRVMMPIILASALITVGAFFSSNNLVPYSYNKIYTLHDDILKTKDEIKIPAGTFYDGIEGYVLRTESTDEKTGMMHGIMVYDHSHGRGNVGLSLADSARLKMSEDKEYLTFTLYNGTNYQETNSMKYRDTSLELQKINFVKQEMLISLENYAFEKTDSTKYSDQIKCMNVIQLKQEKDSLRRIERETREQQFNRLMGSGILSKYQQLDTSFVNRVKTDFHSDRMLQWDDLSQEASAYRSAAENANQMVSEITAFSRESFEYMFYLRRADLEFLRKFAEALACFIMFFIGAPIGALVWACRPSFPCSSSSCTTSWTRSAPSWPRTALSAVPRAPSSRRPSCCPSAPSRPGRRSTTPPCPATTRSRTSGASSSARSPASSTRAASCTWARPNSPSRPWISSSRPGTRWSASSPWPTSPAGGA